MYVLLFFYLCESVSVTVALLAKVTNVHTCYVLIQRLTFMAISTKKYDLAIFTYFEMILPSMTY